MTLESQLFRDNHLPPFPFLSVTPAAISASLSRCYQLIGKVGFAGLIAATLLTLSARWFWMGEIASSFLWQLGWLTLAGGLFLLAVKQPKRAAIALLLGAFHLYPELGLYLPAQGGFALSEKSASIRVATCNLLWSNTEHENLRSWIASEEPDVLILEEVSPSWKRTLQKLKARYPHQLFSPKLEEWDENTWGTAILSNLAFDHSSLIPMPGEGMRPAMECVVYVGRFPITFRGAHPMRPGKSWKTQRRGQVLDALAQLDWSGRSVLLGDLNTTSGSPAFTKLIKRTALRDSRQGFGRQPSYVTRSVLPGLAVAIDHVLVSDGVQVLNRRTSVLEGSDHRMVVADIAPVPRRARNVRP